MDLREIIARNIYAWNVIVGPGGHGTVSFDDAREHYGDFINKHFEEADELIMAMLHWEPDAAFKNRVQQAYFDVDWLSFRHVLKHSTPAPADKGSDR